MANAPVPAYWSRRKRRGNEICQILIRRGDVRPEHVRIALRKQAENGGQIGRILVRMGACSERAIARALLEQVKVAHGAERTPHLATLARRNPEIAGLEVACRPGLTWLALLASDACVFLAIAAVASACDLALVHRMSPSLVHYGFASLALSLLVLTAIGSHRAIAPSPPDEIRTTTLSISLVFLSTAVVSIFRWEAIPWRVHAILFFEWLLTCVAIPIARGWIRGRLSRRAWWGQPAVVLGAGQTGRKVVAALRARPQLGLRPVFVLDDDPRKHGTLHARLTDDDVEVHTRREVDVPPITVRSPSQPPPEAPPIDVHPNPLTPRFSMVVPREAPSSKSLPVSSRGGREPSFLHQIPESVRNLVRGQFASIDGVPIVGGLDLAPLLAQRLGVSYAILAMPSQSSRKLLQITERTGGAFAHLLVIPDLAGFAGGGVPAREIAGVVGLEVQQTLLLRGPRMMKRAMDLAVSSLVVFLLSPVLAFLALAIRLDSKGPALYSQSRLGVGGKPFTAFKFRTMHGDGEERLKALLDSDPAMRAEYDEFHKLTRDPRITRIGRLLRKYSLDELPQILNVLRGDMSLVGPRPYLPREVPDMENHERIILRAMPGMTGLWQVSDRNATGFAERVKTDVHYVRTWSPWLDIYVIARTFGVVIAGTGS